MRFTFIFRCKYNTFMRDTSFWRQSEIVEVMQKTRLRRDLDGAALAEEMRRAGQLTVPLSHERMHGFGRVEEAASGRSGGIDRQAKARRRPSNAL